MKKLLCVFISVFFITAHSNAQRVLPFKPSFDVVVKGALSVPVSGGTYTSINTPVIYEGGKFKDYFGAFPGAQLELIANLTSSFGIWGAFNADFLTPKDARVNSAGATFTESNATQLAGSIGPRVYINIPGNFTSRIYTEAGFGIYSFKYGEEKIAYATNPPASDKFTYSSASQIGFNVGAGVNIITGAKTYVNVSIKYHNILKKTNVSFAETWTHTVGTETTTVAAETVSYDIAERGYIQVSVGYGFKLGL